jgi:putative ATPase
MCFSSSLHEPIENHVIQAINTLCQRGIAAFMDLFTHANKDSTDNQPLPERLRPRTLDEMLGQPKILGEKAPWRRLLQSGQIPSLILWGPPGCGKTTFALLLAQSVSAEFITVNAVDAGAKLLREIGDSGRRRRLELRLRTLLFVDEIHRLNKAQQDVLLPAVEKGDLILVGATTENPSYEINSALLSRCRILVFERLCKEDLRELAHRAAALFKVSLNDLLMEDTQESLIESCDGDGRRILNLLEIVFNVYQADLGPGNSVSQWPLTQEGLASIIDSQLFRYDKAGDEHYDTVSAFIKSVRGSDPNAAVYYLARMIKGGEDPVFIARRLVILASEDIGNADPRAITLAISGLQAVELVGWPEAAISLAQVTTYLASAPKSNRAYIALQKAQEIVEKTGTLPIPLALRSAKSSSMRELGYGKDYKYSHMSEKGFIRQQFLPELIKEIELYEPTDHGFEKNIRQYLEWLKT